MARADFIAYLGYGYSVKAYTFVLSPFEIVSIEIFWRISCDLHSDTIGFLFQWLGR